MSNSAHNVSATASSTGFSYFFLARLGDWELARRRERELVAIEERECRERWEGEKEGEKSLLNPVSKIGETVRKCENCIFPSKMADFSADEDPLSSLEDFLVDRVDDLWLQSSDRPARLPLFANVIF